MNLAAANGTSAKRIDGPSQFTIASWRSGAVAGLRAASRANSAPAFLAGGDDREVVLACDLARCRIGRDALEHQLAAAPLNSRIHCALCSRRSIASGETAKRPSSVSNGLAGRGADRDLAAPPSRRLGVTVVEPELALVGERVREAHRGAGRAALLEPVLGRAVRVQVDLVPVAQQRRAPPRARPAPIRPPLPARSPSWNREKLARASVRGHRRREHAPGCPRSPKGLGRVDWRDALARGDAAPRMHGPVRPRAGPRAPSVELRPTRPTAPTPARPPSPEPVELPPVEPASVEPESVAPPSPVPLPAPIPQGSLVVEVEGEAFPWRSAFAMTRGGRALFVWVSTEARRTCPASFSTTAPDEQKVAVSVSRSFRPRAGSGGRVGRPRSCRRVDQPLNPRPERVRGRDGDGRFSSRQSPRRAATSTPT